VVDCVITLPVILYASNWMNKIKEAKMPESFNFCSLFSHVCCFSKHTKRSSNTKTERPASKTSKANEAPSVEGVKLLNQEPFDGTSVETMEGTVR